jgi:hypothetical protein
MAKQIDERDYVAEFLANGGTVTQVPIGQRSDPETIQKFYGGRPKKQLTPEEEAAKKAKSNDKK